MNSENVPPSTINGSGSIRAPISRIPLPMKPPSSIAKPTTIVSAPLEEMTKGNSNIPHPGQRVRRNPPLSNNNLSGYLQPQPQQQQQQQQQQKICNSTTISTPAKRTANISSRPGSRQNSLFTKQNSKNINNISNIHNTNINSNILNSKHKMPSSTISSISRSSSTSSQLCSFANPRKKITRPNSVSSTTSSNSTNTFIKQRNDSSSDDSDDYRPQWDIAGRVNDMEQFFLELKDKLGTLDGETNTTNKDLETINMRLITLESEKLSLEAAKRQSDENLLSLQSQFQILKNDIDDEKRKHKNELDDVKRESKFKYEELSLESKRKIRELDMLQEDRIREMQNLHVEEMKKLSQEHDIQLHKVKEGNKSEISNIVTKLNQEKTDLAQEYERNIRSLSETIAQQLDSQREANKKELESEKQKHKDQIDDLIKKHKNQVNELIEKHESQMRDLKSVHNNEVSAIKLQHKAAIDNMTQEYKKKISDYEAQSAEKDSKLKNLAEIHKMEISKVGAEISQKNEDIKKITSQLNDTISELNAAKELNSKLKITIESQSATAASLEAAFQSYKVRISELENEIISKNNLVANIKKSNLDFQHEKEYACARLLKEETLRRKLHNQIQELKGNIRVYCRVKPLSPGEKDTDCAFISFPDQGDYGNIIEIQNQVMENCMGKTTQKTNSFSFDHVFPPKAVNSEVFDEISQLVQSAIDGYNVCIFAYGQTGSGKTYTMLSDDGMIPRAVNQIFESTVRLREQGWEYELNGQFLEIYNEHINDLLGKPDEIDKKKHEIRHDHKAMKTIVTELNTIKLTSPELVKNMLLRASSNRSVAATQANQRSSRSHSIFILDLEGKNSITGEKCNGVLNLVDLAGSERLNNTQVLGDRLRETQAINKSLSCLGDVICALGNSKDKDKFHIPYRNSKLTYLLQYSLSGNSKTLMFVNISPLKSSLNETINSLRFATKVNSTHIGVANKKSIIN